LVLDEKDNLMKEAVFRSKSQQWKNAYNQRYLMETTW